MRVKRYVSVSTREKNREKGEKRDCHDYLTGYLRRKKKRVPDTIIRLLPHRRRVKIMSNVRDLSNLAPLKENQRFFPLDFPSRAGKGNRTPLSTLEGSHNTTIRYPQKLCAHQAHDNTLYYSHANISFSFACAVQRYESCIPNRSVAHCQ